MNRDSIVRNIEKFFYASWSCQLCREMLAENTWLLMEAAMCLFFYSRLYLLLVVVWQLGLVAVEEHGTPAHRLGSFWLT